jgi:hypothetical protein
MTGIKAKVVADSISKKFKIRLITLQLRYPRFIHAELMTHRVFSRNASSSRAIPVMKMLKQVWNDPAMPVYWGENKVGMQATKDVKGIKLWMNKFLWKTASKVAVCFSFLMHKFNLHKQLANRITEPWQYISVILTSTEWDNFFELRDHPAAQPEIQELAGEIKDAIEYSSTPKELMEGEWHLPYINDEERKIYSLETLKKLSTARNARVSYLTHDGNSPDPFKDIKLHDDLVVSVPIHASPTEHVATPADDDKFHKNFRGWIQYREEVERNAYFSKCLREGKTLTVSTSSPNQVFVTNVTYTTKEIECFLK